MKILRDLNNDNLIKLLNLLVIKLADKQEVVI